MKALLIGLAALTLAAQTRVRVTETANLVLLCYKKTI